MEFVIGRIFAFSASHRIDGLSSDHKCGRLHGHTYSVEVTVSGKRDSIGFVTDFGDLDWVRDLIAADLDHQHLNDVMESNPTSENLVEWLLDRILPWAAELAEGGRISAIGVRVAESPLTFAFATRPLS